MKRSGFTLIEISILMGVFAILSSVMTINVLRSSRSASLTKAVDTLVSDIQSQQTRAMTGDTVNGTPKSGFGIHIASDRYILFSGGSYTESDPTNSLVLFDSPITATTTFPNATLIFSSISGEVSAYSSGFDTITVTQPDSNQTKTIRINRYGIVTSIQ